MKIPTLRHLKIPYRGENKRQRKDKKNNGKSNRGGIPGHKGATQKFIPQRTTHHKSSACPRCSSTNITAIKTKKRIMVSIPPPQQYEVTEHRYSCQTCHNEFQNDGNLPPQGNFDGSVIRSVVDMFSKRMPHDTIKQSLQEQHGLHITKYDSTVNPANRTDAIGANVRADQAQN